jgi:hypothetical protein
MSFRKKLCYTAQDGSPEIKPDSGGIFLLAKSSVREAVYARRNHRCP